MRVLVVAAERVRQTGVRVARDVRRRHTGERLEEGAHLRRAERAVDADDQRPGVLDREPERVRGLAGEVAARPVDRGEGDPERQLGRHVLGRDDRRLRVERVEDRLDQQQVDTALPEAADLLGVGLDDLVEGGGPVRRVVHLGAERERDVQRPDRAGDEAAVLVRDAAGEACALDVQLVDCSLEAVVGLADRRRREGVRGRDVATGLEVRAVDRLDDVGTGEVEQVGIAAEVARMIGEALAAEVRLREAAVLEQHAPRPVEDGDAFVEDAPESCRGVCQRVRSRLQRVGSRLAPGSLGVW